MAQFAQVNCIWGYFIFECVYLCIVYKFIYELSIDHQYKIQYQVGKSDRYLFRFLLDKSKFIESGLILEKQPLILVNGWMQRGGRGRVKWLQSTISKYTIRSMLLDSFDVFNIKFYIAISTPWNPNTYHLCVYIYIYLHCIILKYVQ